MKAHKTNAARLLDKAGCRYDLVAYEVDESDLSAVHLAESIGEDPDRVFKTLVLSDNKGGYFVCLLPGGRELDLKKAAKASGNKSCALIPVKDLQGLTGYLRGGCSPIGMKKRFPTFVHNSVQHWDTVYVSAGLRGLQLLIAPADLLSVTEGITADLAQSE
ncbi:Cys-tRNA(Pro) deacylase [Desulfovibrio sp. OttesenSCG-928-G15]|nr:Cys-tRNA(Pro) deacylase [Desulfovibrio sp. OttesenSCG-928-G15]